MLRTRILQALGAALLASPAAAQTVFAGSPLATSSVDGLGLPAIPVVGQSFVLPTGTSYLQQFTLFLGEAYNGGALRFDAAVYELGAATPLFTAATGVAGSANVLGFTAYTFATPNLLLDPLKTYAFLLTATGVANGDPEGARNLVGTTDDPNGVLSGNSYDGGTLVAGDDAASLFSLDDSDAAFQAAFTVTATPEPMTLALVAGGLALVGAANRRRRTR